MKITKHLLEEFISLKDIKEEQIVEKLNQIGLEVESFQKICIPHSVVIGKILQKDRHPNADKLNVCRVDVGREILQIVCGASNVQEGQWVAVALKGSVLHTHRGILVIETTQLRGVESNGMICSSVELGLPKLNEGIMILDSSIGDLECGASLSNYGIFDNFVIELGLTPNRGDCLSVLGVARDLSVALGIPLMMKNYRDENTILGIGRVLQVANKGNFSSSVLYKVINLEKIDTPFEILLSLALCDIDFQSPFQNFLNYAIHSVGVILQAYAFEDFQEIENSESKREIKLKKDQGIDCVCGSQSKNYIGITANELNSTEGMMVLEASYIYPKVVSEILYHNPNLPRDLQITYKTTRGSNPDLLLGMQFLCDLLIRFAQIEIYSSHHRIVNKEQKVSIKATFEAIDLIFGTQVIKETITSLLKKLGFKIEASCDDAFFMAIPPFYRQDLQSIQDLAEEILRFYGIQEIQGQPLAFIEQSPRENSLYFRFKAKRDLMKRASAEGFHETLHYIFCQREKMQKLGLQCVDATKDILNPMTNELDTLRTSLVPSMLDSIERNKNFDFRAIAFCEIGICYTKDAQEIEKLAFATDIFKNDQCFAYPKGEKWNFYRFAESLAKVIGEFELKQMTEDDLKTLPSLLHPFQSAWILKDQTPIGYMSKINPQSGYEEGFIAEIILDSLLKNKTQNKQKAFSKFQASTRDLTLLLEENVKFSQIKDVIHQANIPYLQTFYPLDLYKNENLKGQIALSLRFVLQSMEKTLSEEELNVSMQNILEILEKKFGARLRS